jgi:hypothetical protein
MKNNKINMKEYNFSAYRKENLHTLRTAYFGIKKELKLLKEEHNIQWKENEDHSWSVNIPLEVYDKLAKWTAELEYLKKLIKWRKLWSPQDWGNTIRDWGYEISNYINDRVDKLQKKRLSKMTKEEQFQWRKRKVQRIEKRIKRILREDNPNSDCTRGSIHVYDVFSLDKYRRTREKLERLFGVRTTLLDEMFLANPIEIARLEEVNGRLQEILKTMEQKIATLYRRDLEHPYQNDWHGEYQGYVTWDCGSKSYEGDEVYGSDFESMIDIKYESDDTIWIKKSDEFLKYPMKTDKPSMSDEELGLSMKDMYEDDWKEGHWRRIPEIEHIKVCHTIHHMFNHQDLPIVDILHICNFTAAIVRKLSNDSFYEL